MVKIYSLRTFIINYLRKKKLCLFFSLLSIILYSMEASLGPYLLKLIIDAVNQLSSESKTLNILIPMILYIVASLLFNLNFTLYHYFNSRLYPKLKADIIKDMFSYIIEHSYSFFQNSFAGNITKKILDMSTNIEVLISMIIGLFLPMIFTLLIASIILFVVVHPIFAFIMLVWAILFIYLSYINTRKLELCSAVLSEHGMQTSGEISDSISNIANIKLFMSSKYEISRLDHTLVDFVNADINVHKENMKVIFFQGLGITILMFLMFIFLYYGMTQEWITIGEVVLVLTLSLSIFANIRNIGFQIQYFVKTRGICRQALSIMQKPYNIIDHINAKKLKVTKGLIEFKSINFSYENKSNLFNNLNITLYPGKKVGLVGYSGGGKSTFIKLILRLIETQSGSILIDNQDITKIKLASLVENITIIPQNPDLFHRTIMENIRFVKPKALDNEVILAAKKAKCHEFILHSLKDMNR